jgi:hypothetical protein
MSALKHGTMRVVFALLCLTSWFVMANHCGLLALASRTSSVCPHCANNGKTPPAATADCCWHLKITSEKAGDFQVKCPIAAIADFVPMPLVATPAMDCLSASARERGPPADFVSILLCRSLQAHAPPASLA